MPGGIPASLRVTRRYYQPDSNNIIQEYENAKTFGDGAAQEWNNGLETLGKEAMADAARWEKWESQMQLGSDLSQVLREYDLSSFPKYTAEVQSRSAGASVAQLIAVTNGKHGSEHKGFIAVSFSYVHLNSKSHTQPTTTIRRPDGRRILPNRSKTQPNFSCRTKFVISPRAALPEWIRTTASAS